MQVVLVMFRPDGQRRSFSIVRDMTVIGRREDCDLRIPLGDVSRKHCRLIKDGDALRVEDLGSSNGTYRNGQRIQQSEFAAGDTLQVGPVVFVLQIDGVPEDEELQPVTSAAGAVGAAAAGEAEDELTVVEEEGGDGDDENAPFDPMEALSAAEGSGFEFAIEEEMAAAAAAAEAGEEDVQVDLSEGEAAIEAAVEAPAEVEEAPAELEEAEVVLDDEAPAEADEVPVDLEEAPAELEEVAEDLEEAPVDLEESEHDRKA
jgi:hypothetical protein